MSAHQLSTSHTTWKEHGSRTEQRRHDRNSIKGRQRPTINLADYTDYTDWLFKEDEAEQPESMPAPTSTPTCTYTPRPAPTTIHLVHVDIAVYNVPGLGTLIGYAHNEWQLKRLLTHPSITYCNGASLHGTIGHATFSGCINADNIDNILKHYR